MASVIEINPTSEGDGEASKPLPAVEVRTTSIGQGVFAMQKFRRGEVIAEVLGDVIADADYSTDYCIDLGNDCSLEPHAPFRFLNHSCEPNAELFQYVDEDLNYNQRMWIHAIRKIKPGEQITIDYAWPAHAAISCRCDSPKCRGWIVDPDELKLVKELNKQKKHKKNKKRRGKK